MEPKEYVYTGEPVPDLTQPEWEEFLFQLQRAVICSLEKRGLLSHGQAAQCMAEIEIRRAAGHRV